MTNLSDLKNKRDSRVSVRSFVNKIENYDDLLEQKIGQFGKGQAIIIFLICIPIALPGPMSYFAQVFLAANPDHWCSVPELAGTNLTNEEIKALTIPRSGSVYNQCKMYDVNFLSYLNGSDGNITADPNWNITNCKNGWDYDKSVYHSTVVTDLNLVCNKDLLPVIANSISNFGVVAGGVIWAWISDKYGRKIGMLLPILVTLIMGISSAFSPGIFVWMTLRTILVSALSLYLTVYVYCIEIVGKNFRSFVSLVMALIFCSCIMITSGVAYLAKNWKYMSFVLCIPSVIAIPLLWFLPESPRWLLNKGRLDQLHAILTKITRLNNKEPFEFDLTKLKKDDDNSKSTASFMDFFKTPNLRKKFLVLVYLNFISVFTYFGLSLFSPALGSNPFVAVCLAGVAEIPGDLIAFFLMDRLGRRLTVFCSFFAAGIFSILVLELKTASSTIKLVLFLLAKTSIAANQMPMVPFNSELLPTELRNLGLSVTSNLSIGGLAMVPFITYMGQEYLRLPLVIIGGFCIAAAFCTILLPETLHQPLSETVQQAEEFGKNMTWKDYFRFIPLNPADNQESTKDVLDGGEDDKNDTKL